MYLALFVIYAAISVATATPILVQDCGVLDAPFATYYLANDIPISNLSYGFVCLNIKGNGITLDGNGHRMYSASGELLSAVGVQYTGTGATVTNLNIAGLRTGIHANAKFGKVHKNTISHAVNGIDVTAPNNEISNNIIRDFEASEASSGIYVYFPAVDPVESSISITNNIISNIKGESFVLGISVYYATAVYIAYNQIFDLHGAISNEEISVINGEAKLIHNVFASPSQDSTAAMVLSGVTLVASLLYYFYSTSSISSPPTIVISPVTKPEEKINLNNEDDEEEEKQEQEKDNESESENENNNEEEIIMMKKKMEEKEEAMMMMNDGADVIKLIRRPLSFSIGTSPGMG